MKNPNEYTDEEIYEMLLPKFERANLQTNTIRTLDGKNDMTLNEYWHNGNKTYQTSNQVKQAIALAYKSGYLRAQKGRSFIIGEKKEENKASAWTKINLPSDWAPADWAPGQLIKYEGKFYVLKKTGQLRNSNEH